MWYTPAYFLKGWQFRIAKSPLRGKADHYPALEIPREEPNPYEVTEAVAAHPLPEDFEDKPQNSEGEKLVLYWRWEMLHIFWKPEYFGGVTAHFEIHVKCKRAIPITGTGYRSLFCPTK